MVNYRNQFEVLGILDGIQFINDTPHVTDSSNQAFVMLAFYKDLGIDSGQLTEIQQIIIRLQILQFNDKKQAKQFLQDWNIKTNPSILYSLKYIPGSHYHISGNIPEISNKKFNSEHEAKYFIKEKGYLYGGLKIEYVYK